MWDLLYWFHKPLSLNTFAWLLTTLSRQFFQKIIKRPKLFMAKLLPLYDRLKTNLFFLDHVNYRAAFQVSSTSNSFLEDCNLQRFACIAYEISMWRRGLWQILQLPKDQTQTYQDQMRRKNWPNRTKDQGAIIVQNDKLDH